MSDQNAPFFVDNEVITLTRNGVWIADGVEISHEPTRKLFAKSLKRTEKGYSLFIGRESKEIHVEDTAYFVIRVDHLSDHPTNGDVELLFNDERKEILRPATLKYRPGRLTCVRQEEGEEAKFLHSAYFDLLKDLEEDNAHYFLTLRGQRFNLSKK